ncbi:MAG: MerR family transcriptional regulator [Acidimicrobiales bacterium]
MAEDSAVSRAAITSKAGRGSRGARVGSVPNGQVGMPDDGYRGPQVCQLVGISYRQLDYWARTGLLQPSLAEAHGSGTKRRYSYRDLLELKVIKRLLDGGVSLQSARRAVGCLREDLGADLAAANLVLSDTTSVLAHTDGELVDLLAGGQGVFNVVPLSGVVNELAADIVRIERPTKDGAVEPVRQARAAGG